MNRSLSWITTAALLFSGINMSCVHAQVEVDQLDICVQEYEKICPQMGEVADFQKHMDCSNKNKNKFSPECWALLEEKFDQYNDLKRKCEKDLKKYCGIGLSQLAAQNRGQCVVEHWGDLEDECRKVIVEQVPYLGLLDQAGDLDQYKNFGGDYKKKKLPGSGKAVKVVHEEGGITWYLADLIKKDIKEQYEFCPEVADKGLKRYVNDKQPSCGYEVMADWENDLIQELKKENLLYLITDYGILDDFYKPEEKRIYEIVNKFNENCPQGFMVDFYNYNYKDPDAYCVSKKQYNCSPGWYRTSPRKDGKFFGCRLYASCEEVNSDSYEIGDPRYCAVCQAGGCIDPSKTETSWDEIQIGYCQVNAEAPAQTPGCEKIPVKYE